MPVIVLKQGCQNHFHRGPYQLRCCLQRAKRNFNSLTVKEWLHLYSPKIILALEGNREADVAPLENEFDTAVNLNQQSLKINQCSRHKTKII